MTVPFGLGVVSTPFLFLIDLIGVILRLRGTVALGLVPATPRNAKDSLLRDGFVDDEPCSVTVDGDRDTLIHRFRPSLIHVRSCLGRDAIDGEEAITGTNSDAVREAVGIKISQNGGRFVMEISAKLKYGRF